MYESCRGWVVVMSLGIAMALGFNSALDAQTPKNPITKEVAEALQIEAQALDLAKQGKASEAEQLYKQSLAVVEKALPDDPILAGSLNNIGNFYISQRRYADAALVLARAVTIFASAYGDNKVETATAINNLAGVYMAEGKYQEAEPLYVRGLTATETLVGPEHYAVAMSLDYLAQVTYFQRRYADAAGYLKRAMVVAEKALGGESPLMVTLMDHMISVLKAQGREQEAKDLLDRANAIVGKNRKQ